MILGHESSGKVIKVGPNVKNLQEGNTSTLDLKYFSINIHFFQVIVLQLNPVYLVADVIFVKVVVIIFVLISFFLQHHLLMEVLHVIIHMLLIFVLSKIEFFSR
jgi:hypothetical protein